MNIYRFLVLILLLCSVNTAAASRTVKIGSGSIMKGYYAIALDLCKTMTLAEDNIKCEVVPTNGGVENLTLLHEGKIDLALVQANIAVEAFKGIGYFEQNSKMPELRQVLNLYDELFTVIVKDNDKLKIFGDIEGEKVSNGPASSGSAITYNALVKFYNFKETPIDVKLSYEDSVDELCQGKINAIMMMAGHPNPLVSYIANKCEIDFLAIENAQISKLIESNHAFHRAILSKGLYPGITEDQNTVAVPAILVTREDMDFKLLDKFIGMFHRTVSTFQHATYLLHDLDIKYFADTKQFVLPKHPAVRNRK